MPITNIPLSIEEYSYYLFPGTLVGDTYIYDKEKHCAIRSKLANALGEKTAEIIHKMGSALTYHKATKYQLFVNPHEHIDAFMYSFMELCSLPQKLFNSALGVGFTGIVFDYEPGKVIKLSFNGFTENELLLYKYQIKNKSKLFPYIHYYDHEILIMEKLRMNSPKLNTFREYVDNFIEIRFIKEHSYRVIKNSYNMPSELLDFILQTRNVFETIYSIRSIGDLKGTNIGERIDNGDVVYFDPIGSLIVKS